MRISIFDILAAIIAICSTIIFYRGDIQEATYFILIAIFVRLPTR